MSKMLIFFFPIWHTSFLLVFFFFSFSSVEMDNIPSHVDLDLWQRASHNITWIERPRAVIDASGQPPNPYVWFPGGKLNTCYNCVDRHDGNAVAVIYDSAVTNTRKSFTFAQLREHVVRMAGVLRNYGVQKGDTVLIYMPMVPEAVFCMLACARLGAVHSVVFGNKHGGPNLDF